MNYAPRNDQGFYTWAGEQYRSVTTYLGYFSPGEHLLFWYGKMAAGDCALQLDRVDRGELSLEEGHAAIRNIGMRMRAGERYRDFKGNIGTLVHHAAYAEAFGTELTTREEAEAWMLADGVKSGLLDSIDEKTGEVIPGSHGDYERLAIAAAPYHDLRRQWVKNWNPAYLMSGHEACIVNRQHRYAGTLDTICDLEVPAADHPLANTLTGRYLRLLGEKTGKKTVRIIKDFKTSTSISDTFAFQVEAYARAEFIGVWPGPGSPDAQQIAIGDFDGIAVLHIKPDPSSPSGGSCELVGWEPSERRFHAFLGLMDMVDAFLDTDDSKPLRAARITKEKAPPKRTTEQPCPF